MRRAGDPGIVRQLSGARTAYRVGGDSSRISESAGKTSGEERGCDPYSGIRVVDSLRYILLNDQESCH